MTTDVPGPVSVSCSGAGPGGARLGGRTPPVHRIVLVVDVVTDDPFDWITDHLPPYGPGVLSIQSTVLAPGDTAQ